MKENILFVLGVLCIGVLIVFMAVSTYGVWTTINDMHMVVDNESL